MPDQQAIIENIDGLIFLKGFVYLTRYNPNGSLGTSDAIQYAAVQNISFNYSRTLAEISGSESLSPVGVGIQDESLTGTLRAGSLTPEQLVTLLGGTMAYDSASDITTFTKLVDHEPEPFDLKCWSPANGSNLRIYCYRCVANTVPILEGGQIRNFSQTGIDFRVYGQNSSQGLRLFSLGRPGDTTGAS